LIPRKEINNETDPLWSIEIRRQSVNVCKGLDEKIIFEIDPSISVKPQQYAPIFVCSTNWDYTTKKVFPLSFFANVFFLLSASLISCIPYLSVHKLFLLLGMKALKFHMLHMFAFDESQDLVMIPISLPLTT